MNQGHNARGGGYKQSSWNFNTKTTGQNNNILKSEVVSSNRKGQIPTVNKYMIMTSAILWVYLGVKTCEVFLCFLAIILFYITCEFQGFYTEDESSRERGKVKLFSLSVKLTTTKNVTQQINNS